MIDTKNIKLRVIDRYDYESGEYIEEEHDVHVCSISIRYENSKGEHQVTHITADNFLEQYYLVKK
jgi:hypothetical protein